MSNGIKKMLPSTCEKRNILCIILITFVMLLLLIRSFFSFCQSDEALYTALAHRFYMGDKPVIDEWHPVQFYIFVIYPFYWLYKLIVPSGEGVILFFRILQKLMAYGISIFSYKQLRKISGSEYPALFCTLAYQLYLQANIEGMSYYNMYISMLVLTIFMIFAAYYENNKRREYLYYFFSGVAMAIAVLCCPYLTIGVAIAIVVALVVFKNLRKQLAVFILGICITAVSFLALFMPHDIELVKKSLSFILHDPEHTENAVRSLINAEKEGFTTYHTLQLLCMCAIGGVLLFFKYIKKKYVPNKYLRGYLLLGMIFIIPPQLFYIFSRVNGFNYFSLSISAVCILVIALIKKVNIKKEAVIYSIGIFSSFFSAMASNTRSSALTSGLVLAAMAVILGVRKVFYAIMIYEGMPDTIKGADGKLDKKGLFVFISRHLYYLSIMLVLVSIFANRMVLVYRDDDITKLNTRIEAGPAKGLYTTKEHYETYNRVCTVFDEIKADLGDNIGDKNIYISKLLPWGYLCFDCKVGAYSMWRIGIDSDRLIDYYDERPEKIPDIVVVLRDDVGAYKGEDKHNENNLEGEFWEYIQENYTVSKTHDVATVWYKR